MTERVLKVSDLQKKLEDMKGRPSKEKMAQALRTLELLWPDEILVIVVADQDTADGIPTMHVTSNCDEGDTADLIMTLASGLQQAEAPKKH